MRKLVSFLICVCLVLLAGGTQIHTVNAATPRVMVSDYSITEGKVFAGEDFTLNITLKNTAAVAVRNVKLTISTEQGEFLPTEGAGTAYVDRINGDTEVEFSFSMTAIDGLEEKSYKLILKTEYENSNGGEYTVDESIFIPVNLEQRLSITDIFIPESYIELGETVEVSAAVNNLGDGTLYNVSARITGENIAEMGSYVGNIEPGKSGMIDVLTKATGISVIGDRNWIIVSYEDKEGHMEEKQIEISVAVNQPVYENLEKVKEATDYSVIWKWVALVTLSVLLLGVIVWYLIRRRKQKQKILEEF